MRSNVFRNAIKQLIGVSVVAIATQLAVSSAAWAHDPQFDFPDAYYKDAKQLYDHAKGEPCRSSAVEDAIKLMNEDLAWVESFNNRLSRILVDYAANPPSPPDKRMQGWIDTRTTQKPGWDKEEKDISTWVSELFHKPVCIILQPPVPVTTGGGAPPPGGGDPPVGPPANTDAPPEPPVVATDPPPPPVETPVPPAPPAHTPDPPPSDPGADGPPSTHGPDVTEEPSDPAEPDTDQPKPRSRKAHRIDHPGTTITKGPIISRIIRKGDKPVTPPPPGPKTAKPAPHPVPHKAAYGAHSSASLNHFVPDYEIDEEGPAPDDRVFMPVARPHRMDTGFVSHGAHFESPLIGIRAFNGIAASATSMRIGGGVSEPGRMHFGGMRESGGASMHETNHFEGARETAAGARSLSFH